MSGTLRELLELPEVKPVWTTKQLEQFRQSFSEGMAALNRNLQVAAAAWPVKLNISRWKPNGRSSMRPFRRPRD